MCQGKSNQDNNDDKKWPELDPLWHRLVTGSEVTNTGLLTDVTREEGLQNGESDIQIRLITHITVFMISKGVLYASEI